MSSSVSVLTERFWKGAKQRRRSKLRSGTRSIASSDSKRNLARVSTCCIRRSRDCIDAARILYCGIADEVANIDYEVFKKRARVSMRERLWVALPAWRRAVRARRRHGAGHVHGINPSYALTQCA